MATPLRSGSGAKSKRAAATGTAASAVEQEWRAVAGTDRREADQARARTRRALSFVVPAAVVAALLPSIFPLNPGFAPTDTGASVLAATVTAVVAIGIIPLTDRLARGIPGAGAGDVFVFGAALLSAGAATIHFAVAKVHFDEYTLFGVFFVGSGLAQLAWPLWLLLRRWRPLLLLGALGNALIVALWAVDRIWGLPLGPTPWEPDPVGFGDSATSAFEVVLVAVCIALLIRGRGPRFRGAGVLALTLGLIAITALGLLSVLGVGSSFLTPTE
jgi:hypothetical protein